MCNSSPYTKWDGSEVFSIPKTIARALGHEDAEFWRAAMLEELSNHEEIFNSFGPPIAKLPGMKATPTRFLFSKKIVSLEERQQAPQCMSYKAIQESSVCLC